jgi:lipopolysaccharide transport system ATP-binding protein
MAAPVISVQGVSKDYALRTVEQHERLYDVMSDAVKAPLRFMRKLGRGAPRSERFWALRDIGFELKPGEVLGIIGRNGAGKSTLLKILSRITAPTEGKLTLRGRMASLLEVGTGFHPELSGRENIYLNGAILGMTRREIDRKFDEIVAFAEIDRFIDTPVKRYSSGMYVRLAFAVAAHLEPDILVIDEVLAVGDAEFQKKCLGKIGDVAVGGRAVLFVSHNMQAVQSLCTQCMLLKEGRIAGLAAPSQVISQYLESGNANSETEWTNREGIGNEQVRLTRIQVRPSGQDLHQASLASSTDILVEMQVTVKRLAPALCIGFDLFGRQGTLLLRSYDTDMRSDALMPLRVGTNVLRCVIPGGMLNAGTYQLAPRISIHNQEWIVDGDPLVTFSVVLTHGESPFWNGLDERNRPGLIAPILVWEHAQGASNC